MIGPLARFIAITLAFFGVWLGTATANDLKGWRSLVLPLLYLITVVTTLVFLVSILEGTLFTFEGLIYDLGLSSGQME